MLNISDQSDQRQLNVIDPFNGREKTVPKDDVDEDDLDRIKNCVGDFVEVIVTSLPLMYQSPIFRESTPDETERK